MIAPGSRAPDFALPDRTLAATLPRTSIEKS